mmetsp:Transcript_5418/g.13617  ORF Transcript_5418/g.13617 Transcript_5418/m.13617 type:complete len:148 (+) Transcript_5418:81-524(+)
MKTTKVDQTEQDIPIVTDVIIIDDVESNVAPPATNPELTTGETQSAKVPATNSVVVTNKRKKKSRIQLHSNLGRQPYGIMCEHCQKETITIVQDRVGMGTIIATILLALVFWPLCWLPFCMPSCKRTNHFCGHASCKKKIGVTHVCS